jgi:hypothetical protein
LEFCFDELSFDLEGTNITKRSNISNKEEWNYIICRKMVGTGDHHVQWEKPSSKSQILLSLIGRI